MKGNLVLRFSMFVLFVFITAIAYSNTAEGTVTARTVLKSGFIQWTMSSGAKVTTDVVGKLNDAMEKHMREKNKIRVTYDPRSKKASNWVTNVAYARKTN